ncbi:hypothetical protein [Candidatus Avelusimicrobium alvi]|uniref:hypothetical protein n=1 Tax=Candidatus Avelusimicrobium alvi TaxID=3416221 RepID=UPI003D0CB706
MVEVLTNIMTFAVSMADKAPWLMWTLVVIGGVYVLLMVLQPLVLAVAKLTKTEKDDAFWAKVYGFLTDYGPCFAPPAALFKKKVGYEGDKTIPRDGK